MVINKLPYFQVHLSEVLPIFNPLSLSQKGLLITALMHTWTRGEIRPLEPEAIADELFLEEEDIQQLWNNRMRKCWAMMEELVTRNHQENEEYRSKQSERGIRSGEARRSVKPEILAEHSDQTQRVVELFESKWGKYNRKVTANDVEVIEGILDGGLASYDDFNTSIHVQLAFCEKNPQRYLPSVRLFLEQKRYKATNSADIKAILAAINGTTDSSNDNGEADALKTASVITLSALNNNGDSRGNLEFERRKKAGEIHTRLSLQEYASQLIDKARKDPYYGSECRNPADDDDEFS